MKKVCSIKYHPKRSNTYPHPVCDFIDYILYVKHIKLEPCKTRPSAMQLRCRATNNDELLLLTEFRSVTSLPMPAVTTVTTTNPTN